MLDAKTVTHLAAELDLAERNREQVVQFTQRHPDITIDDAYEVQRAWVSAKVARGAVPRGHKIGLTSRAMQQAIDIDEPDHGVLLDDMFFDDGSRIPVDRFIEPRVEVELAFVLSAALGGRDVGLTDVLKATAYVVPALEIIDARIVRRDPATGRTRRVQDTIADNAANAGVIMGGRPCKPDDVDLRWVAALFHKNGTIEESGVAAAVLNHPANGVAWLTRRLSRFEVGLARGDIVLAGSFTRPMPVVANDVLHVDYGPLGTIACRFV